MTVVMATTEQLESWILEYACARRYQSLVHALSQRRPLNLFEVSHVRIATLFLDRVIGTMIIREFDTAIQLVNAIYNSAGGVVSYKHYAKLISGLKIKHLFYLVKNERKSVLPKLNEYFPRKGDNLQHPQNRNLMTKLHAAQMNFRRFFLSLLANERQYQSYMQDEYPDDYGKTFVASLQKLSVQFVETIELQLPKIIIQQIMDMGTEMVTRSLSSPSVALIVLLDSLSGKSEIAEQDLLDVLTTVCPLNSQDNVDTGRAMLFDSDIDSDSLQRSPNSDPVSLRHAHCKQTGRDSPVNKEMQSPTSNTNSNCNITVKQHKTSGRRNDAVKATGNDVSRKTSEEHNCLRTNLVKPQGPSTRILHSRKRKLYNCQDDFLGPPEEVVLSSVPDEEVVRSSVPDEEVVRSSVPDHDMMTGELVGQSDPQHTRSGNNMTSSQSGGSPQDSRTSNTTSSQSGGSPQDSRTSNTTSSQSGGSPQDSRTSNTTSSQSGGSPQDSRTSNTTSSQSGGSPQDSRTSNTTSSQSGGSPQDSRTSNMTSSQSGGSLQDSRTSNMTSSQSGRPLQDSSTSKISSQSVSLIRNKHKPVPETVKGSRHQSKPHLETGHRNAHKNTEKGISVSQPFTGTSSAIGDGLKNPTTRGVDVEHISDLELWISESGSQSHSESVSDIDYCSDCVATSNCEEMRTVDEGALANFPALNRMQKQPHLPLCVVKIYRSENLYLGKAELSPPSRWLLQCCVTSHITEEALTD